VKPRKFNEPFRARGTSLGEAMRDYAGDCYCDDPAPGESGTIVCTSCALLAFAEEADALLTSCEALVKVLHADSGSSTAVATARAAIKRARAR